MTEKKNTKRSLVWSGLALIICVSMLIGSTFAWFTDSASTGVNKIQSGNLDVALEMLTDDGWVSAEDQILNFVKAEGHEEEAILWEPGCTYSLPPLRVVNKGNLALKYELVITGISGDAKLNEAIEWNMGGIAVGTEQHLLAGETSESFTISGHMKKDAGNEYMDLSIDGIAITVYATQDTVEYDSTTNQYDADATLPSVWDGTVGTLPEVVDGVLTINNASELAAFAQEVNRGLASTTYAGVTVNLTCDIDLAGYAWTPIGLEGSLHNNFQGTFDGNGHTIYNMTVSGVEPVGFFGYFTGTVKNLKFDNANVSGNHFGGVIAGYASYDNTLIENCTVSNSTVKLSSIDDTHDGDKAGAITGYLNGQVSIKNNTVDNCQIYAKRDAGALLGCNGTCSNTNCIIGNTVKNSLVCTEIDYRAEIIGRVINGLVFDTTSNTAENVTVKSAKIVKSDDSATVINALKSNTEIIDITLTGDVEINGDSGTQWTNAYGGSATQTVTIDGQGKYTLTIKQPDESNHVVTNGAELVLKNLKLSNSGHNDGPWNRHDIVFDCKVTLENVVSDKAIALCSDASMKNVTIADRNTDSTYALWIQAKGQNVTLDNLTISNVGGDTRAIAIKDEYVGSPARVNLTIKDSNIASNKKAAILVTSTAGATINASNVDISAVTADTTNLVWVDNNPLYQNISDVTCTGGTVIVEP